MSDHAKVLLKADKLAVGYDLKPVLRDLTLSLQQGELVGLIGPNGSGKSTLIRTLAGLASPLSGSLSLMDADFSQYSRKQLARHIALIPQHTTIQDQFSVRDIVAMGRNPYLGAFKPEADTDRQAIEAALRQTDMLELAQRAVNQLSGGEQQRVFIARALAQQAPILIADEPISSLDIAHQLEVLSLFQELAQQGKSCLCAIHDLNMAARFCDRLILVSEGKLALEGKPRNLLTRDNLIQYFDVQANPVIDDRDKISIHFFSSVKNTQKN